MEKWGLGYEDLKRVRPNIIMVSLSGLGHYGPLRDFLMFVPGMEGMSGLTHMTGYPDEPPCFPAMHMETGYLVQRAQPL